MTWRSMDEDDYIEQLVRRSVKMMFVKEMARQMMTVRETKERVKFDDGNGWIDGRVYGDKDLIEIHQCEGSDNRSYWCDEDGRAYLMVRRVDEEENE